uniref:Uncharacterized protein n=1 Tax=Anguilla anguilla TaxID=7936 RepID=A0A0E9PLK3_ANGAN
MYSWRPLTKEVETKSNKNKLCGIHILVESSCILLEHFAVPQ